MVEFVKCRDPQCPHKRAHAHPDSSGPCQLTDRELLSSIPRGDIEYVREPQGWGVAVFERGTTERLATLATRMDKSVAAWLARALRDHFELAG